MMMRTSPLKPVSCWFYKHVILNTLAFCLVPFWSMAIDYALYVALYIYSGTRIRMSMIMYLIYVIFDPTPTQGGYRWWSYQCIDWIRSTFPCTTFAQYYPLYLIKTADLPVIKTTIVGTTKEQENTAIAAAGAKEGNDTHEETTHPTRLATKSQSYIFLYHPHGIIGIGAIGALMTNGCQFNQLFPGIRRRGTTLNICFTVPFYREWILLNGVVSANKSTLQRVLTERGESIILLPGGAVEALHAQPGRFCLYLKKRKGFCRLAIETGAQLVPVLGFGENNSFQVHKPSKESWLSRIQQLSYRIMTFSTPILTSVFPQTNPIHVVVGKPIEFQPNMSVDDCHALYLQELTNLYNQHKDKYGHTDIPLEIM